MSLVKLKLIVLIMKFDDNANGGSDEDGHEIIKQES